MAIFSQHDPDLLIGARLNAPLVVGIGEKEWFIASDITAIIPYTKKVLLIGEGEMVSVTPLGPEVSTLAGTAVKPKIIEVKWDVAQAQKGGYAHFMAKEINEASETVSNALRGRLSDEGEVTFEEFALTDRQLLKIRDIKMVAAGTSYYAALLGKYIIEDLARVPVEVEPASEFRYRQPIIDENTLVLGISQSGETADTLAAIREARRLNAKVISITNLVGSSMALESDGVFYLHAGPVIGVASTKTCVSHIAFLYLLGSRLAQARPHCPARHWLPGLRHRHRVADAGEDGEQHPGGAGPRRAGGGAGQPRQRGAGRHDGGCARGAGRLRVPVAHPQRGRASAVRVFRRRRARVQRRPAAQPRQERDGRVVGFRGMVPRVGVDVTAIDVSIAHDGHFAIAVAAIPEADVATAFPDRPEGVRLPDRPADGHKGTFGTVVVLAGSQGFTGAAYLASNGAARTGAGLVRLLAAQSIYPILAEKCTEVMVHPVPEVGPGVVGDRSSAAVLELFAGCDAAVIGPGLGRDPSTRRLLEALLPQVSIPVVLDADGLNLVSEVPGLLARLPMDLILTPHPGEFARLAGLKTAEVQADRVGEARRFAKSWRKVVVLKGAQTVIADPDGRLVINPVATAALASGGTGDVLAGVIGALRGQGLPAFEAAVTGVYVHGLAGQWLERDIGRSGVLAGDLLPQIPRVMERLRT